MRFDVITIFPNIFSFHGEKKSSAGYFDYGIMKRALAHGHIQMTAHDLRAFSQKNDRHKSVDDRPYGGGPGMILTLPPIFRAVRSLHLISASLRKKRKTRIILLSPTGKKFDQRHAQRLSKYKRLIFICARYEGYDARVEKIVDEKISIGDYILAGGELAAMVMMESIARHTPGVVGHKDALQEETFSQKLNYNKEYFQYSRPEIFHPFGKKKGAPYWSVPKVLLGGNHEKIRQWRRRHIGK